MRENKLTTPPVAFGRRFKQVGKRVPAIENSPSASDSFAAKIAQREGKLVECNNPAYIDVLLAEIERKRISSSIGRTKPKPPKTPAKTGDHNIDDLLALTRLRSSCRPCSLIHLISLPIMTTWTGILPSRLSARAVVLSSVVAGGRAGW